MDITSPHRGTVVKTSPAQAGVQSYAGHHPWHRTARREAKDHSGSPRGIGDAHAMRLEHTSEDGSARTCGYVSGNLQTTKKRHSFPGLRSSPTIQWRSALLFLSASELPRRRGLQRVAELVPGRAVQIQPLLLCFLTFCNLGAYQAAGARREIPGHAPCSQSRQLEMWSKLMRHWPSRMAMPSCLGKCWMEAQQSSPT